MEVSVLAGIAFIIAQSKLKKVAAHPEGYEVSSVKNMNTAKIIVLVILIINLLFFIKIIFDVYTIGWDELTRTMTDAYQEALKAQGK